MNNRMFSLRRLAEVSAFVTFALWTGCNDVPVSPNPRASARHDIEVPMSRLAFVRDGRIYSINVDGTELVQLTSGPSDCSPAWSPDAQRIAFVRGCNSSPDIYIMDADGSNVVRRTVSQHWTGDPTWSPDSRRIAYSTVYDGGLKIFVISAADDGTSPNLIVSREGWNGQPAWSPDGTGIAFVSDWVAFDFTADVFVVSADGSGLSQITNGFGFNGTLVQYYQPAWSPDGRLFAIVSCFIAFDTCGTATIAVMNTDGSERRALATTSGFAKPAWSPDGGIVAYGAPDGSIAWVSRDGAQRGVIVENGSSPAWRP